MFYGWWLINKMFKLPKKIKDEIETYAQATDEYLAGKSSWARFTGIRVPWGNYSHRGGKVFMARIRVPGGLLTPLQLKALAECAKIYGDGLLHITTRQDIQIHNIKTENIIKVHHFLKDYELSSRGGGGNTVRNIIVCPLAGVCDKEIFDVREGAVALTEYLLVEEISYNLPRKFKIAFSGCNIDCAGCLVNDVGILAVDNDSKLGWKVFIGGGMGAHSSIGKLLEEFISRKDLGYVVTAIRNAFYKYGNRKNKHHNRLRFLVDDIGFEKFKEYYLQELNNLKEVEDISLRQVIFSYPQSHDSFLPVTSDEEFKKFIKYNCQKQKQNSFFIVKLRIPRGDLRSNQAENIAKLTEEFPGIEFRTTAEQNLYVVNIDAKDLYRFFLKLKEILTDFLYPSTLLDIVACKGSATCNLGLCNSPGLAQELEGMIRENFLDTGIFDKLNIKINGCPNACGQHPLGIISFCGAVRKVNAKQAPFYRLFLGGRRELGRTRIAKNTGILIPAKNVPMFLKDFLRYIEEEMNTDIDIHKYIEERGEALANQVFKDYAYVPDYSQNRDFYIDWGLTEEFSLEGLSPGECGAGILDMIESDLTEAKIALEQAEKEEYPAQQIRQALFLASRSLLVVMGVDPQTEKESITAFIKKFVEGGIADQKYFNLKDTFDSINDNLSLEDREEKFIFARKFLSHIQELYKSMDSTFNFPKLNEVSFFESGAETAQLKILDLKGTPCPMNYVKAKLFLESLNAGEIIDVLLDDGEPIKNVPKSLEIDGHKILKIEKKGSSYSVIVEKGG